MKFSGIDCYPFNGKRAVGVLNEGLALLHVPDYRRWATGAALRRIIAEAAVGTKCESKQKEVSNIGKGRDATMAHNSGPINLEVIVSSHFSPRWH
jgi:hypothetical protein